MANSGVETVADRLKETDLIGDKPDFRELDLGSGLGSPVSPLRTRSSGPANSSLTATTTTTTSSSSSSSGSFRANPNPNLNSNPVLKGHSGELETGSVGGLGRTRPGHTRSGSTGSMGSYSGLSLYPGGGSGSSNNNSNGSVNSPPLNVLPTGNIICPSGRLKAAHHTQPTPPPARRPTRPDVLGSGSVNYGHGSIMRSGGSTPSEARGHVAGNVRGHVSGGGSGGDKGRRGSMDGEEVKRMANEQYKKGNFAEALYLYDRAISISPGIAAYRSNRAAALTGLGRVGEAVKECEEAVRLDPNYGRARHRLGSLLLRLGQVEVAKKHLSEAPELLKLQAVEKHLSRCSDARIIGDWKTTLREGNAAISAGADHSPQLFLCRAESLLKLQQLDDVESILSNIPKIDPMPQCCSHSKSFGMLSEAYLFYVRAQIEMALGRFENAVSFADKAGKIDPRNVDVAKLLNTVKQVSRARARGNELFNAERFTEACAAYGEGLRLDPSNSVIYGNRAACWYKLAMWEKSIEDCNHALRIQPNYTKALLRRAAANNKLERWAEAVRDYEALRKELPQDPEVAESLFHAQVALKKSRGEEVLNMKFGGDVEEVTGLDHFRATISSPGLSVVHFENPRDADCQRISCFLDTLCGRYPSINFVKVDVEGNTDVADFESVKIVPTVKLYKNGNRVKEIINPTNDVLEASVRHYSF